MGYLVIATGERAAAEVRLMERRLGHRARGRPRVVRSVRPAHLTAGQREAPVPAVLAGTVQVPTAVPLPAALSGPGRRPATRSGFELPAGDPAVVVCDGHPPDAFALAALWEDGSIVLARGPLGLRPLYYLERDGRPASFASEMKALCPLGPDIRAFPPGHVFVNGQFHRVTRVADLATDAPRDADAAAVELARLVEEAVERGCRSGAVSFEEGHSAPVAVFLSGGIDSSVVAAAAASRLGPDRLRSFAVGTADSTDLPLARLVARHLGIRHTEQVFGEEEVREVLPDVIYHLESFDAPLVRSSVANYLVGRMAAEAGCRLALCGEGGDELFAGYSYLKTLQPRRRVAEELVTLLEGGHANGFQRVDRMTAAHGLEARVPLSAPDLVAFAMGVPLDWKIHPESGQEKWLLRQAFRDRLPRAVVERPKAKFYEGSGTESLMLRVADSLVSDADLEREQGREIGPGLLLDTKEKLLYYRIFREYFPHRSVLETIGWTRTLEH